MLSEKRASVRAVVSFEGTCVSQNMTVDGTISCLSRSGLFLHSEFLEEPDEPVEVSFNLPGRGEITLAGKVVRASTKRPNAGMAVTFASDQPKLQELREFMRRRVYQSLW